MRKVFISTMVVILLLIFFTVEGNSQLVKLTAAYSAIAPSQAPMWITKETGLFEKYGTKTEIIFLGSGTQVAQGMIAGDIGIAILNSEPVINSNLRGADLTILTANVGTITDVFVVSPDITTPAQLKGKKFAISRFGGGSDFSLRFALRKLGIDPEKEVSILQIGSEPARFSALQSGGVHGTVIEPPLTAMARKLKFRVMADLSELGAVYQKTGISSTRSFIAKNRETVRKFMKGYIAGIAYYKTHKDESIKIIAKYMKSDDLEGLEEVYNYYGLKYLKAKPYPLIEGLRLVLEDVARKEPKAKNANPADFVDMSFVRELDESGFIDSLYK